MSATQTFRGCVLSGGDMVGLWSLYGANGKKIFVSVYRPRSSTASILVTGKAI